MSDDLPTEMPLEEKRQLEDYQRLAGLAAFLNNPVPRP